MAGSFLIFTYPPFYEPFLELHSAFFHSLGYVLLSRQD